jgi:hypothetical protein
MSVERKKIKRDKQTAGEFREGVRSMTGMVLWSSCGLWISVMKLPKIHQKTQ